LVLNNLSKKMTTDRSNWFK